MLVNLNHVFEIANKENKAVGAFNVPNLESLRGVIQAAEETNSPVIIQHAETHGNLISLQEIGPMMIDYAKRASVPVVVQLDHGENFETCVQALQLGFTSVMYDASNKPFETNIQETKEIVKIAHALDATVEAEIGQMLNSEIGAGERSVDVSTETTEYQYTTPAEAKEFAERTGVDALAIAFGTMHGVYLEEPDLNLERIAEIKNEIDIPLVMHGGSGLSYDEYTTAINNGIRKINYYTYTNKAAGEEVYEYINNAGEHKFFDELSVRVTEVIKENVIKAIDIFNNKP